MRVTSAAYIAALGNPVARPLVRVLLANHGGAFADPLDVTDHLISVDVTRPLRDGNGATIRLHNGAGRQR
jgi:hypothetical protein